MSTNSAETVSHDQTIQRKNILLVDDSSDILESVKAVLDIKTNYVVKTAANALDVKRILKDFCPEIALLDIKLENGTGFELIPSIKLKNPDAVCVMMTAYRDVSNAVNAVKSGADDYLFKPLDTEVLLSTIDDLLIKQHKNKVINETLRRIQTIFELTSDLFFLVDTKGILHEISQTALDFAGIDRRTTINKVFWESSWWGNYPEFKEPIKQAIYTALSGKRTNIEIEMTGIDNKPTCFDLSLKPILGEHTEIDFVLIEGHDITARKHIERRLNRLAHYDALTGLPNRVLFDEHLSSAISRHDRHNIGFALMYIDLDNFKEVNDGLGHHAGDQLLLNISRGLMKCMRGLDAVSRVGGDEFIVILTDISDYHSVKTVADRIMQSVIQSQAVEGQTIPVSASGGIAIYPDDGLTAHSLTMNADKSMYAAKSKGKNRWMLYSDIAKE
jgi:diguanylate cyclase (GGDEF)-like protein/PAS domain S-box-containing protein